MASVLVMMSGGVDSSVAAALLVEQGHDVTGVTLKLWGGESDSGCCSVADVEDARRVAAQLGIAHYVFNFSDDFARAVVDPYVTGYANGTTPNPCVACNREMKWGRLLRRAHDLGYEYVATGHHARVVPTPDGPRVARGVDFGKDQSYVLATVDPAAWARTLLPIGTMTKAEVRAHASRLGLRTATKAESMDVCFITRGGRDAFLRARVGAAPGRVVDTDGSLLGEHSGVASFTIGQRRGLDVAVGERRYVVDVDASSSTITIGDRDALLRTEILLCDTVFPGGAPTGELTVQTRAHGATARGRLRGDTVELAEPTPRVAPGQVVALYDADVVVGAGYAV
ncbi:MAG TPA: tRNA 2-thiouridine(34) synthase MnmA [Acidimicrobiia bacterium]|nr:tRNA 2-thiouridine(34) synthase MnmA [Acidimicrobiia bacterium]